MTCDITVVNQKGKVFIAFLFSLTMTQRYEIENGAITEGQSRTLYIFFKITKY